MTTSNIVPLRISERRQSRLDQAIRDLARKHALMMALLETSRTCRHIAEELRQADEDRRANLARLGADMDGGPDAA